MDCVVIINCNSSNAALPLPQQHFPFLVQLLGGELFELLADRMADVNGTNTGRINGDDGNDVTKIAVHDLNPSSSNCHRIVFATRPSPITTSKD